MKTFQVLSAVGLMLVLPAAVQAGSYSSTSKGSYSSDGWLEKGKSDFEKEKEQIKAGMKAEQPAPQSSAKSAPAVSIRAAASVSSPSTISSAGAQAAPAAAKISKKKADSKQIPYREQLQKALAEWTGKEGNAASSGAASQTKAGADQK